MNEAKMTELAQAEDMAYFKADLCLYSPESYTLEEKKEICNDMMATSSAILDAMRLHPWIWRHAMLCQGLGLPELPEDIFETITGKCVPTQFPVVE